MKKVFLIGWLSYFVTYLGRLNYSASLAQMIVSEGFSKEAVGLIGTAFFFSYGIGQFVSGFLGDKLSPRKLVGTGLLVASICNISMAYSTSVSAMVGIWCINGLFQALIWSPMLKLFCSYFPEDKRKRVGIWLNTSVPVGTIMAYAMTAAAISVAGWQLSFKVAAVALVVMAVVWTIGMKPVEQAVKERQQVLEAAKGEQHQKNLIDFKWRNMLVQSGLLAVLMVLVVQGVLKDGVTTWVPNYIGETYGVGTTIAIMGTTIIPLFNLTGIYVAAWIQKKWLANEMQSVAFFFAIGAISLGILYSSNWMVLDFLMLAISTTTMMAVNTLLIAVVPTYFDKLGRTSSVSGVLNACVYVGGAVSTYGIGVLSVAIGWGNTMAVGCGLAVLSLGVCLVIAKRWQQYKKQLEQGIEEEENEGTNSAIA